MSIIGSISNVEIGNWIDYSGKPILNKKERKEKKEKERKFGNLVLRYQAGRWNK